MQAKLDNILTVDMLLDSCCNICSVISRRVLDIWRDRSPQIEFEHCCGSLADGSAWISDSFVIVDVIIPCMSLNLRHKSFRTKLRIIDDLNVDVIIGLPDIVRCNLFDVMNKQLRISYEHLVSSNLISGIYLDRVQPHVQGQYYTGLPWIQNVHLGPNLSINSQVQQVIARFPQCFDFDRSDKCLVQPFEFTCRPPTTPIIPLDQFHVTDVGDFTHLIANDMLQEATCESNYGAVAYVTADSLLDQQLSSSKFNLRLIIRF
jgi:hypothetical protein